MFDQIVRMLLMMAVRKAIIEIEKKYPGSKNKLQLAIQFVESMGFDVPDDIEEIVNEQVAAMNKMGFFTKS